MKLYLQNADNKDAARALRVLSNLTASEQALLKLIAEDEGNVQVEISDADWLMFGDLRIKGARAEKDHKAVRELSGRG